MTIASCLVHSTGRYGRILLWCFFLQWKYRSLLQAINLHSDPYWQVRCFLKTKEYAFWRVASKPHRDFLT
jgi:hypothetical protein